jgi:hypothetical protein
MSMATFAGTYLNPALRAIAACHNGTAAPANGPSGAPLAYQCWVDTTANPSLYKIYDGASWITLGSINTTTHVWLPYLTAGVSGGVPYFSATNIMGSSAALALNGFVVGGGAGAAPATIAACTDDQIAFGRTSSTPLCRTVSGDITFATGVSAIGASKVTNSQLATMAANTTKCNATAGTANPTDCTGSTMRTNLGVVIGTNVEAWDADLDALAANSTDGFWAHTGAGTGAARTLTAPVAGLTITNPAGIAGNPTFALANDLAALEGLSSTGIARRTGTDAWSVGTAVSNAELATMAAFTFKGNNTSGVATPTDVDIAGLTAKASPASTDLVILSDQAASGAWKKATISSIASAGSVASFNGQTGAIVSYFEPQGRLTLQTAVPVMVTTQSAKTTIYYTPYHGNMVPIYDGTNMVPTAVAEISVLTTDTTKSPAAIGASKVNDWFVWSDAGTIRVGHGPDWTNDTTRSAGTALVMVNGILLNSVSITNGPAASRGTYVGTTRSNGSSQLDWIFGASSAGGTAGFFGVWNAYNRVKVSTFVNDSTDSWNVTSASYVSMNGSAGNRVTAVRGLDEDGVTTSLNMFFTDSATGNVYLAIGLDSTSAFSGQAAKHGLVNNSISIQANYSGTPGLGVHFWQALEATSAITAINRGDNGEPTLYQGGLAWTGRQ